MVSFGTILDHFVPTAAQILQMVSVGTILDHFVPNAAQMLQMVSFGTILDHFVPKAAQMLQINRRPKTLKGLLKEAWSSKSSWGAV